MDTNINFRSIVVSLLLFIATIGEASSFIKSNNLRKILCPYGWFIASGALLGIPDGVNEGLDDLKNNYDVKQRYKNLKCSYLFYKGVEGAAEGAANFAIAPIGFPYVAAIEAYEKVKPLDSRDLYYKSPWLRPDYQDFCTGLHEQVRDISIGDGTSHLTINKEKFSVIKDYEPKDFYIDDFTDNESMAFISHSNLAKGKYEDLNHVPKEEVLNIRYKHTNCVCDYERCIDPLW